MSPLAGTGDGDGFTLATPVLCEDENQMSERQSKDHTDTQYEKKKKDTHDPIKSISRKDQDVKLRVKRVFGFRPIL